MALTGDTGARKLLGAKSGFEVQPVEFTNRLLFEDIDTAEDLSRLEQAHKHAQ
jgi:CTP:molybdopterin cytidylyltransferase MocA